MGRAGSPEAEAATITRYVLLLLGLIVLALVLYQIRTIIAVVYISFIVAATIHPLAVFMQRWMPRLAALVLIYFFLVGDTVLLGFLIIPPLVVQIGSFLVVLPDQLGDIKAFLESVDYWLSQAGVPLNLAAVADQIRGQLANLALRLVQLPLIIYEFIALIIAIVALSFYWLLDRDRLLDSLLSLLPSAQQKRARIVYYRSERRLGAYTRGIGFASVVLGVLTYLGLLILGVPFPLLLAIAASLLEVVPIVGPFIAAIPILGVAFSASFNQGLAALVFWVGVQILEGNVITPLIQREAVSLAPFTILLAILIGGALLGFAGALLAIPTAVLIGILIYELAPDHLHRDDEDGE